jgi:hypothetical protein
VSRIVAGLATAVLLASPLAAHAQPQNRTVIRDSGNGVNNTITVRNAPITLHAPTGPGYAPPAAVPQAPAVEAPVLQVGYQTPYDAGQALPPPYPATTGFGGPAFNRNLISNSGNGANNAIRLVNRSGAPAGYGYDPSAPFPYGMGGFGVNINVVTNSGNGAGNTINTFNRGGPGGININVITNSGNGVGNTIGIKNR